MKLFIDTEFNDFKGALISMALVDEDGQEWYEVLDCDDPSPWVAANVMPRLGKRPTNRQILQHSLMRFLQQYRSVEIIADWPEDIQHFCDVLITGPGMRIDTPPLTMQIRRDLDNTSETSKIPHNALEDAKALRLSYFLLA